MKNALIKTVAVAVLLSTTGLTSFASPAPPHEMTQLASENLGIIVQSGYSVAITGDLVTGQITGVSVRDVATGLDYTVQGWDGAVSSSGGVNYVQAKIYIDGGSGLIRLNGALN